MTANSQKWRIRIWAALVFLAGIWELIGLRRRVAGSPDTLSEYTWSKTKTPVMRGAVVGLVAWLVYHFSFGEGTGLGSWDAIAAGAGVVIGVISSVVVRGRRS